jgi:predicted alpha/beta hydrolase family esterase
MNQHNTKTIIHIHGGIPMQNYQEYVKMIERWNYTPQGEGVTKWTKRYDEYLPKDQYTVIQPDMPNKYYADYYLWDVWFKKVIATVSSDVILVGYSLGAVFLAQWLSQPENASLINIASLHLVAGPYDHSSDDEPLGNFGIESNDNLSNIPVDQRNMYFYYSKDDPIVPYREYMKYKERLPDATFLLFEDRGHFFQESFPELFENMATPFE